MYNGGTILDKNQQDSSLEEAAERAVDYCIKNDILAEFLSAHRAEVCELILTEYDEELHIASEKEISREEGMEIGIRALIMDNLERHVSEDIILQKLQKYFSLDHKKAAGYLESVKNG